MRLTTDTNLLRNCGRYWAGGKRERGVILDEFCMVTGYHRKYAIEVLRGRQLRPVRQAARHDLSSRRLQPSGSGTHHRQTEFSGGL
jgi:hypothetical protein